MKKYTRGFTLIELLVVIAIIGILSSVVLVSLNSARSKGKDAKIQAELAQVRTQLEADYNGGYADLTGAAGNIAILNASGAGYANLQTVINDIGNNLPTPVTTLSGSMTVANGFVIFTTVTSGTPSNFGVYSKTSQGYVCLDSYGNTKVKTAGDALPANYAAITAPTTALCQ